MTNTLKKHILQPLDIIFSFSGSVAASIGKNGLVTELGHDSIVGRAMCIIRPSSEYQAVWLYHQLNSKAVQEWIQEHISGKGKSLSITVENIKNIPLPPYEQKQADTLNMLHNQILDCHNTITMEKKKQHSLLENIKKVRM